MDNVAEHLYHGRLYQGFLQLSAEMGQHQVAEDQGEAGANTNSILLYVKAFSEGLSWESKWREWESKWSQLLFYWYPWLVLLLAPRLYLRCRSWWRHRFLRCDQVPKFLRRKCWGLHGNARILPAVNLCTLRRRPLDFLMILALHCFVPSNPTRY